MPFTLAHPAAVLPLPYLSRRRLRLAALAIGSATPDFEYFRHLMPEGGIAHTPPGILVFCLPAGWLALWLFDRYGRAGVQALLPRAWTLPAPPPRPYHLLWTSLAIALGAATHLFIDSFTHRYAWTVGSLPGLTGLVPFAGGHLPWFRVLQHVGTFVGLAVLAAVALAWIRRQPPAAPADITRRGLLALAVLGTIAVANGLRFLSWGLWWSVSSGAVAAVLGLGVGLIVLGAFAGRSRETAI